MKWTTCSQGRFEIYLRPFTEGPHRALNRGQESAFSTPLYAHRSPLTASTERRQAAVSECQAILKEYKNLLWTLSIHILPSITWYGDKMYFSRVHLLYEELRFMKICHCYSHRCWLFSALPVERLYMHWLQRGISSRWVIFLQTESGPYKHSKRNCLPHVYNTGSQIEQISWKVYHAQVRMHGRTAKKSSKGRITKRHQWRLPTSGADGSNWNRNLSQKQESKCGQTTAWQFSSSNTFFIPPYCLICRQDDFTPQVSLLTQVAYICASDLRMLTVRCCMKTLSSAEMPAHACIIQYQPTAKFPSISNLNYLLLLWS